MAALRGLNLVQILLLIAVFTCLIDFTDQARGGSRGGSRSSYRSYRSYSTSYRSYRSYRSSSYRSYRAPTYYNRAMTRYNSANLLYSRYSTRLSPGFYYYYYINRYYYYDYASYRSSHRIAESGPGVCKNYEANKNGTYLGIFQCPMPFEPSDLTYCCGDANAEYCCRFSDNSTMVTAVVLGVLACVAVIIVIVVCCCKSQGKCKSKPRTTVSATQPNRNQGVTRPAQRQVPRQPQPKSQLQHAPQQPPMHAGQAPPFMPPPSYPPPPYPPTNTNPFAQPYGDYHGPPPAGNVGWSDYGGYGYDNNAYGMQPVAPPLEQKQYPPPGLR